MGQRHSLRCAIAVTSAAVVTLLVCVPGDQGAPAAQRSTATAERWHFAEATHRSLLRLRVPETGSVLARPVRVGLPAGQPHGKPAHWRAWDIRADREAAVQVDGSDVLVDPGAAVDPGGERVFILYAFGKPDPAAAPPARLDAEGRVETERYAALVDARQGGAIKSLLLKEGARRTETLGEGIRWWVGRKPQVTQESFGAVEVERLAEGPVFTHLRVTYANLLAEGNELTTDYRFFRDFIDVDHHYRCARPTQVEWLKLPVTFRATGSAPGLYSNSRAVDQPLRTEGKSGVWTPDPNWHDVSYLGDEPFGIGVISRDPTAGAFFHMDSVRPDEQEWVYAEPFGWERPREVSRDFDVRFTVVPHPAGKGRYRDTTAKIAAKVSCFAGDLQARGAPPADTDRDGLSDLAEVARLANPACADTDGDGLMDGKDPDPLQGPVPALKVALPRFRAEPTTQAQTVARVRPVGGVPTLVLDGKPYGPMTYTRCAGTHEQIAQIADRGFPVHFEMVGSIGWPGAQEAVFKRLDEQLGRFLDAVPNARIILRLYVCNPPHFARDYPEETLRFNDGGTQHFTKWYAMKDRPEGERGYPSFASEVWRQNTAEALFHYVTHVRQASYACSVIGYFVCGGGTEEWYYWGDYDHGRYCVDTSPPMLKAFREYLRARYGGDVRRLRTAWGDGSADFGSALPPGPQERSQATAGVFWDPEKSQRVRDYYYIHNKAMEDSLLIFSRAVKQACGGEQLVGMFHGYLQNHWLLEGGQATLKDLLASPDVDFWSGPPQYNRRGHGEHACIRFPIASLKQHGKLWISESDIRTSFSEKSEQNPALYGRPPDLAETLACLKREYAHQLCEGGNGWWFQMGKEWYHHEPILDLFAQMQRFGEAATAFDRTPDTDIAAVVDLESIRTGPPWPITSSLIDAFKVQETCRIGAPVDHYELDDVLDPGAKQYKLYLMLNCFSLDARERKLIDERLRRNGATLIWMYAPGLFDPEGKPELSPAHTRSLLGFGLRPEIGDRLPMEMKLTPAGAKAFPGFDPQRVFGSFERPEWVLDKETGGVRQAFPDPLRLPERLAAEGGEVLARYVEGGGASIAMRRTGAATDIWIGSVMAPADLLRAIARQAGCHLFCDADEIVYANKSFLAIHTRAAGERTFHLRRKADVVEVFSGDILGEGVTQFRDRIDAYRTRVYFLGDRKRWAAERERADGVLARFLEELQALRKERRTTRPGG